MDYRFGNVPVNVAEVPSFLQREFPRLQQVLNNAQDIVWLRPLTVEPVKKREGMTVIADGANWNPGLGAGTYQYLGGVWVKFEAASSIGNVTSVGLALPSEFTVSGSPITTSGTLTGAWASQTQNYAFMAPSGANGVPSFRPMLSVDVSDATNANTASKIVKRDASGNFSAGTITAALIGNATTATAWQTARALSYTGDATGSMSVDGSANASAALTLADTAVTAGSYGSGTNVSTFTVDSKGRLIAASNTAISFPVASVFGQTGAIADLSGDVTTSGSSATTIANNAVTLAKFQTIATDSFIGRDTAGTGNIEVLNQATAKAMLDLSGTNTGDQTITLTGDVTGSGTGSFAATLATVNANVGSFGSASSVSVITANAKGLITAAADTAIQIAESQVTGLTSNLAGKQPLDATLTALAAYNTNGILVQIAANTFAGRTIEGVTDRTTITNGNGVSGNPIADIASTYAGQTSITILGNITPLSVASIGTVTGSNLSGTNTGDQTITLTGDVTGNGTGSFATTIGASKVVNSMINDVAWSKVTSTPTTLAGYGITDAGTVTNVSVVTANGISGSVATSTTTPSITLVLGDITPTTVNGVSFSAFMGAPSSLAVFGTSSITGTNTGDVTKSGQTYLSLSGQALTANQINLTSHVTGVLPGGNGGTDNGFMSFSGPSTTPKVFILPNATSTILTADGTSIGSMFYGTGTGSPLTYALISPNTTINKRFLSMTGTGSAGAAPTWIGLTSTDVGLGNVENTALSTWAGSTNLTTAGTFTTATWNAGVIAGQYGGTGVNNSGKTITLGGNLTTSGAYGSTFTMTGTTNVTFPTSGTLATTSGVVTSITGTANQINASASTGAVTLSLPQSIATTSAPTFADLTIQGSSPDIGLIPSSGNGTLSFYNSSSTLKWQLGNSSSSALFFYDAANNNNFIDVGTDGHLLLQQITKNVAIGDSIAPVRKLVVKSSDNEAIFLKRITTANSQTTGLLFNVGNGVATNTDYSKAAVYFRRNDTPGAGIGNGDFIIAVNTAATTTPVSVSDERFKVDYLGNTTITGTTTLTGSATVSSALGVGTSSPIGKLSNTATNWAPVVSGSGVSSNGLVWSDAGNGWVELIRNTDNTNGSSGLGISTANTGTSTYPLSLESGGVSRMYVRGDGLVSVAGSLIVGTGAQATTSTANFLYIATCAGAPTGVPPAFSGLVAMRYDSTNNRICFYNGAWRSVAVA